jgi:acetyl esterase/lipase
MYTATRQLSASLDIWYLENEKKNEKNENIEIMGKMSKDNTHNKDNKSDKKKPLFFFVHGGRWKVRVYVFICICM